MPEINELMATCPLKQCIRENLWGKYVTKLGKKPIKYLTLYSPPLMDVKHFTCLEYINLDNMEYKDVVGITNEKSYAQTISEGKGRLGLLKTGYLHELITKKDKELLNRFPFDVINLDYCNHIFGEINTEFLSDNIEDITTSIEQQSRKNQQKFIIFITTRTDNNSSDKRIGFAERFIEELNRRIQSNIARDVTFQQSYNRVFNNFSPTELFKKRYNDFISVGILKFIIMELSDKGYGVDDCDIFWLIRNSRPPERDLLHLALLVSKHIGKPRKTLSQFGKILYSERGSTIILDRIYNNQINLVSEKNDFTTLEEKYGSYLKELSEDTFELRTPKPISES